MKDLKAFLDLMFDPTDTICVSDGQYGYHSVPIDTVLSDTIPLLSPNPKTNIRTVSSKELILCALNPVLGFRRDENVYKYQTFLWEIDEGSLASQYEYIKKLELPYSIAVFSGGKSIHFGMILDSPIDEKTYKLLFKWVLAIAPLIDDQCGNPTRCIRIPGAIRPETGKEQKLLEIKSKVKLDDFMTWLSKYEHLKPKPYEKRKVLTNGIDYDNLSTWARNQFKYGIDFSKGRNRAYFGLACDLYGSGYTEDEAAEILSQYFAEEHDFKEKEFLGAINSAYKYKANRND